MKTRILVNRHIITKNRKTKGWEPPLAIKQGPVTTYVHEINLGEHFKLVYCPNKPLTCGATVWIEVDAEKVDPQDIKLVPARKCAP